MTVMLAVLIQLESIKEDLPVFPSVQQVNVIHSPYLTFQFYY